MKLCLISAALPPALDGIGDYTSNLAAELAKSHAVSVLCGMPNAAPIPGVEVRTVFDHDQRRTVIALPRTIEELEPEWAILQYCPFSYGRWGLNPYLPRAMRALKRSCPRVGLALTVHEPMAWPINWKLRLMNVWQSLQLRALGRTTDVVFLVVGKWAQRYGPWFPGKPLHHLAVGSNIPLAGVGRTNARARLGIGDDLTVLGVFGQGHHSQLWQFAARAAAAVRDGGRDVRMLHLGPTSERIQSLFGDVPARSDGFLPAVEVSSRLAAVDVFLAPFADGVSTRRTTLMAALQHGLPVVGTYGYATDPVLSEAAGTAMLLEATSDESGFTASVIRVAGDPALARRLGAGARDLYERAFSWPVIAHRMLDALAGIRIRNA